MKTIFLLSLTCMVLAGSAYSQIQPLTGNELPGMMVVDTDTYDSESLQNYTDDTQVVMEYGFNQLLVQQIEINGMRFTLNAYMMNRPEAAFGLYSVNVLNCDLQDTLGPFDCLNRNQYLAASGNLYINLTNETGTPATRQTSLDLARKFTGLNPQQTFSLPDVFNAPAFKGYRDQVIYLGGMNAMQASLLTWQNLMIAVRFEMYAVILRGDECDIYFAQISFPTPGDMNVFLKNAGMLQYEAPVQSVTLPDYTYREFVPIEPLTIYFLQSTEPYSIAALTAE